MLHPLIQLLATRPDLLADHADAYIDLAAAEASCLVHHLRRRLWLTGSAVALAAAGLLWSGVSLMLWAALPPDRMPMAWVLAAVPGMAWTLAGICGWRATQAPPIPHFTLLRQQIRTDAELLREVRR